MKTFLRLFIFTLLVGLIFPSSPVSAQEGEPAWPTYIVQPGDTLTTIVVRFGVNQAELIEVNGIIDPNNLYVGTELILPGVDWVTGTIDVLGVPLGETFRTLKRRYQLSSSVLSRLGSLASPTQLIAGYPLLIASKGTEDWNSSRSLVSSQKTVLELAAASGSNLWEVAAANSLTDPSYALPNDVIFLPGKIDPGPGALPSPLNIAVLSGDFVQGKTTVIQITANGGTFELSGNLISYPLHFLDAGDGSYVALQGVHVMQPIGAYPFSVSGKMADGSTFEYAQLIRVNSGGYGSESLSVDPAYLDETASNQEMAFIAAITASVTVEKQWNGPFGYPVRPGSEITSVFGTRRSFNGSDYIYYHSGVDFSWHSGTDILAPTRGLVVFTGYLNIRGNTTIIDHGWGIYTLFAHQEEDGILVSIGDVVEPGQFIGIIGGTGRSSGEHLHWEVWANGVQVEPLDWLYTATLPYP